MLALLEGVRIIDFTNYLPGPYATMRLADMGAEVIKIESVKGDPARELGVKVNGTGTLFLAYNRKKKSVVLNLKEKEGRETAERLIASADAVIESFRPGVMKRLGLDYASVVKYKEDLVYCSITGFGELGSLSRLGSHDLNYMGMSGILAQIKDSAGKPVHPTFQFADYIGGLAANEAVLAGLISKWRTGIGSYQCISIPEVMVSMMGSHMLIKGETGAPDGLSELNGRCVCYAIYETKDQRYITLGALEKGFWRNFCEAVDRKEWIDQQFSITEKNNKIYKQINELFKSRTFNQWIEFSQKVDCCMAPVLEPDELADYPFYKERGLINKKCNGEIQVKIAGSGASEIREVPFLGEHTKEILK